MAEKEHIEREALLDRACAVRDKLQLDLNNPFEDGVRVGFENVEIEIENYPAADVRPVVRGEWMKRRFSENCVGYQCLNCHTTWDAPTYFCPNCGADMREES